MSFAEALHFYLVFLADLNMRRQTFASAELPVLTFHRLHMEDARRA